MYIDRIKRGTGRTHNMLIAAFAYAKEHGSATVVMSDLKNIHHSMRAFCETEAFEELRNEFEVKMTIDSNNPKFYFRSRTDSHTLHFVSAKHVNIEWYQFRLIGLEQKATFFDHHAIEQRFSDVLTRWAMYDNKLSNLNAAHAQRHFENEQ